MKITQETDSAIRMLRVISEGEGRPLGTSDIAERSAVTQPFALKVLRKLMISGLVKSKKGAGGGYSLARTPDTISLADIILAIDREISVSRCSDGEYVCPLNGVDHSKCKAHCAFENVNATLKESLEKIHLSDLSDQL